MLKRDIFIFTFILIHVIHLTAGSISGIVINGETGQPIPDANVMVVNSTMGTVSRDGGFYSLDNLSDGEHQIQVSVIGYDVVQKTVQVPGDESINFKLTPHAIEFDPVVVTATLSEHSRSNVSVSADVLTRKRMSELNGNTAGEIVESVGGVYVNSFDGFAGINTPSIRGAKADQVLILLDGMRLNTAQGGGVDLNNIPLSAIERVEILRGGHSALLGSDALGGAINLISSDMMGPKGIHFGIQSTIGSFGTQIHTINGIHQSGPIALFATYNRTQSDGNFEYESPATSQTETRRNNDSQTDNLFLKGKYALNAMNHFQVIFNHYKTNKGAAGNVNPNPYDGSSQLLLKARSDVRRNVLKVAADNQLTGSLLLKTELGYHTYDYHYVNPDRMSDDLHENQSLNANLQAIYTQSFVTATGGVNLHQDALTSTQFNDVDDRNLKSVYGQAEMKHSLAMTDWTWIPAVRWDSYSDVGSSTSPKLGLLVSAGENQQITFKANLGKSYRVPTLNDLYWPRAEYPPEWGGGGVEGNPDIKPEYGTNFDAGLVYSLFGNSMLQVEATYFSNDVEDLISWTMDAAGWSRPCNVGQAVIKGFESGIKYRLPSELAWMNIFYTHMKATDETEGFINQGKRLVYRPDNKWDILMGTKLGMVNVNLNYRIVSKSYINADNTKRLDGYQLLNANMGIQDIALSYIKFNVRLQALNLTDEMIFITDGYPIPGREFRFTVGVEY